KPGYLDGEYGRRRPGGQSQPLVLADEQKIGNVRIFMWRQSAILGLVLDEAGEPVVGIQIRALRRTMVGGRRRCVAAGMPGWRDDRGMYRVAGLLPGDYLVAAPSTQVSVPISTAREQRQSGGNSPAVTEIGASVAPGPTSIQLMES